MWYHVKIQHSVLWIYMMHAHRDTITAFNTGQLVLVQALHTRPSLHVHTRLSRKEELLRLLVERKALRFITTMIPGLNWRRVALIKKRIAYAYRRRLHTTANAARFACPLAKRASCQVVTGLCHDGLCKKFIGQRKGKQSAQLVNITDSAVYARYKNIPIYIYLLHNERKRQWKTVETRDRRLLSLEVCSCPKCNWPATGSISLSLLLRRPGASWQFFTSYTQVSEPNSTDRASDKYHRKSLGRTKNRAIDDKGDSISSSSTCISRHRAHICFIVSLAQERGKVKRYRGSQHMRRFGNKTPDSLNRLNLSSWDKSLSSFALFVADLLPHWSFQGEKEEQKWDHHHQPHSWRMLQIHECSRLASRLCCYCTELAQAIRNFYCITVSNRNKVSCSSTRTYTGDRK